MQGQHSDDSLFQAQGQDISSPNTMPCRAPNHGTWEYIDISDLDTSQPQKSQPARGHPGWSPTPPPSSGYAYVSPFAIQTQPNPITTEASDSDGFTKEALFPLPPTSRPGQLSYRTFPAPHTTTNNTNTTTNNTTITNDEACHPARHEPCYFETLDFSDYQHRRNPNLPLLPLRAAADEKDGPGTGAGDAYRPRGRGWCTYGDGGRGEGVVVGRVEGRAAAGWSGLGEEKRAWRAARQVVVVVAAWMLLVGGLVALQWVVGGGGVEFISEVNANARGDGVVHGEWPLCTKARPRFCRLVVGAGEE